MDRSHKPPQRGGRIARWAWKWKVRFEASFAINMLEPWEQMLIAAIFSTITVVFWYSVFTYSPGHIAFLRHRAHYYLYGTELAPPIASSSSSGGFGLGDKDSVWSAATQWVRQIVGASAAETSSVKKAVTRGLQGASSGMAQATASAMTGAQEL